MLVRRTTRAPGYDCVRHPCGVGSCGIRPGGSHGIGSERWWFTVADGKDQLAITMYVLTQDRYPDSVPRSSWPTDPAPMFSLVIHEWSDGAAEDAEECEYLGHCKSDRFLSDYAEDAWRSNGGQVETFEQPESLWLALERVHADRLVVQAARAAS